MYTLLNQHFTDLSQAQLYEILKLRFNIFVWEQQSFYAEYDDHDQDAQHISLWQGAHLAAYVRLYHEAESGKVHLGRVVVKASFRGQKLGYRIVAEGIKASQKKWPQSLIRIGAQIHLEGFYSALGFIRLDDPPYDDGGIMHIKMERPASLPLTAGS